MAFDHVLLIGCGGPETREEIAPFLRRLARGAAVSSERLQEIQRRYELIGGASPYNDCARLLSVALRRSLEVSVGRLPVYLGMRYASPFLADTLSEVRHAGLWHGIAVVLSSFRCYDSFEQVLEDLEQARAGFGDVEYACLPPWFDNPLFISAVAHRVQQAMGGRAGEGAEAPFLIFTAHSLPQSMTACGRYEEEFVTSSHLVAERLGYQDYVCAYQSRAGDSGEPWLEPDVVRVLSGLEERGTREVLLIPIGFLFDHMEVLYDLDIKVCEEAKQRGMRYLRASTVMDHPEFVHMLCQLIKEGF